MIRLQKHIANMGICSRRKAEVLIAEGKVTVNGDVVTDMGVKIDPATDTVEVEGTELEIQKAAAKNAVYIALHKPTGYITSTTDEQGDSVMLLLDDVNNIGKDKTPLDARVFPVGRLDKDSEGLVLLTNDGGLTNQLTHPRYEHEKEYEVTIPEPLTKDAQKVLENGMIIDDQEVHGIEIKKSFNKGKRTIVTVILKEGKNRQIRKMFGQLGHTVQSLKRVRMSKLKLGVLPVGRWKYVKREDIS